MELCFYYNVYFLGLVSHINSKVVYINSEITPVILATWVVEIQRLIDWGQPMQEVLEIPISTNSCW
jgi:hypothetical protein